MYIITLPNNRAVSVGTYARAWRHLLTMPANESVQGWDWTMPSVRDVLRQMREGLHDRINRHDRTQRECSKRRLFTKIRAAAVRGAISYTCRNCGIALDPSGINPNNANSRFCSSDCRRDYL